MVSDSDLVTRLCEILRDSDLDTATAASVRRKLEEDFGVNLSERKAFIREQIDIYLETLAKVGKEEETVPENVNQDEGETKHDVVEEENEEEDSEGEEESETKTKGSNKAEKGVRKRGGFTKLCSLSPKLQKVVGVPELARTEVVKRLWAYIRENDLQDPSNRKNIKCDEALRDLFCVKSINMFQMNKALSKHIWPLTEETENEKLVIKDQVGGSSASEGEDPSEEQENEEEEEEEEEEEDIKKKGNAQSKKGRSIKGDKDGTKRGGGFTKLCSLSPQLQNFIGVPEMARTEVVKKIWAYIREKNLQDPKDKRNIMCDESLHALFRVDRINMFKMNKVLSKHIWPLNEEDENEKLKIKDEVGSNSASEEANPSEEQEEEEEEEEQQQQQEQEEEEMKKKGNEKSKKGRSIKGDKSGTKRGGGFTKLCSLSPQLQEVIGIPELARTEVVKRIWAYIREKNLQDPNDKRNIICDESLHALFQVDSINMFQMNKALSKHIWPINAEDAPCNSSEKEKHGREEGSNLLKQKEKRQKK